MYNVYTFSNYDKNDKLHGTMSNTYMCTKTLYLEHMLLIKVRNLFIEVVKQ